ncbi:MAG: 16S rRNA (cytidine(1402)-2'-O)-methyltransferase [Brooklawnia sp.]|jgi:16S rRNA (cytidine1402-2'-O)-methyltransferase
MSRAEFSPDEGRLVLAGTPIGDAQDASPALKRTLAEADVIAAEDTRALHTLMARLGVRSDATIVSYFEGNEAARTPGLVEQMAQGQVVVLATDAGMPSVSDPGYRLVVATIEARLPVTAVPGPSAVLTALAVSGLPVDRFCFEGFLPRKTGERTRRLAALAAEPRTMVFFEAPHRLADFLADAAQVLGDDRPAAVCRELTKTHEQVVRGGLAELADWAAGGVRGEVTVVIQGAPERGDDWDGALRQVGARVDGGEKLSAAVGEVARTTGLRRNDLYARALAARKAGKEQM